MFLSDTVRKSITKGSVIGIIVLFMTSCASTKPPTQQLTRTEAAINQAHQAGAEDFAPLEIREARKKLRRAKDLVAQEKYKKAARLANRAEVDAELAQAKALSGKAQNAVEQLQESIRLLKEEIEQNQEEG